MSMSGDFTAAGSLLLPGEAPLSPSHRPTVAIKIPIPDLPLESIKKNQKGKTGKLTKAEPGKWKLCRRLLFGFAQKEALIISKLQQIAGT